MIKRTEGRLTVRGTRVEASQFAGCPVPLISPLRALATCLAFNGQGIAADIVHCHTWYAHFGGILAKLLYGIPLVITVHSLEPLRPWKREQIGRGYDLSSWIEKTALEMADAVVAVSRSTRDDILRLFDVDPAKTHVIANGIDTDEYQPVNRPDILTRFSIRDNAPYVLFVGRMTRQKGLLYFLRALDQLDPQVQVVLCAGESDTPELQAELEGIVEELKRRRPASYGFRRCWTARRLSPFTRMQASSAAPPSTSRSASLISRQWPAVRRWSAAMWVASRGRRRQRDRLYRRCPSRRGASARSGRSGRVFPRSGRGH